MIPFRGLDRWLPCVRDFEGACGIGIDVALEESSCTDERRIFFGRGIGVCPAEGAVPHV
jgi:hypothetical protein